MLIPLPFHPVSEVSCQCGCNARPTASTVREWGTERHPQASSSFSKQTNVQHIGCLPKGEKIAYLESWFLDLSVILISVCLFPVESPVPPPYPVLELHIPCSSPGSFSLTLADIHYTNAPLGCFICSWAQGGLSVQTCVWLLRRKESAAAARAGSG